LLDYSTSLGCLPCDAWFTVHFCDVASHVIQRAVTRGPSRTRRACAMR
jgi:hypothetical protein